MLCFCLAVSTPQFFQEDLIKVSNNSILGSTRKLNMERYVSKSAFYLQFINKAQITKSAILVISFICFYEKVANVSAAFSNIWYILTEKWFRDYSKQLGVFIVHQNLKDIDKFHFFLLDITQMYTMITVTHKKESQLTCEASLNMSICPLWICMLESSLPNSLNKNHAVNLHHKNTSMNMYPLLSRICWLRIVLWFHAI